MTVELRPSDVVTFGEDCEVTQIPSGAKVRVPKDTEAYVGQTLGGNVTLSIPGFGLVQVMAHQLSALRKDGVPVAAPTAPVASGAQHDGPASEEDVWKVLKTCYDPEIPVNIVDLGLVYDVKLTPLPSGRSRVDVKMTLTAMGCGMGPVIAAQARDKLLTVPGVEQADVQIVWDPPWNQSMITEEGKKRLGIW
ncbi:MAG: iron-sulfur cluster assembly protein [Verrucomicrobiae bacterium]|nr:iron-sulfur cluster assembly protein [Verrucomicrobiae bacterium]MDW8344669.1 iron-sulfur cluster assembly protein [Verrucomicrobiae bacterium]